MQRDNGLCFITKNGNTSSLSFVHILIFSYYCCCVLKQSCNIYHLVNSKALIITLNHLLNLNINNLKPTHIVLAQAQKLFVSFVNSNLQTKI